MCQIRWILLLQEFDLEIKDKKGSDNTVADHLSTLIHWFREHNFQEEIKETFLDEQLFVVSRIPWYAQIVNFFAKGVLQDDLSMQERKRFLHVCMNYVWDEPYHFRIGEHGLTRRCVTEDEQRQTFEHCHGRESGGHCSGRKTAFKVLQCGFYDP